MPQSKTTHLSVIRWIIALLIGAIFFYPIAVALSTACDWVFGDGQLINTLPLEPKRYILNDFLTYWLRSIPWTMTICCLFILPMSLVCHVIFTRQIIPNAFITLLLLNPLISIQYQLDFAALGWASLLFLTMITLVNLIGGPLGNQQ